MMKVLNDAARHPERSEGSSEFIKGILWKTV